MMQIKSYNTGQLNQLLNDPAYRSANTLPVSPERIRSFTNNPRGRKEDPVLFTLSDDDRLIAYRTLLPDTFVDKDGNSRRFAWLSGNYVDPAFRRMGLSTRLFSEVEKAWEGRLMYTNYAPASKAVYDRTGRFREAGMNQGVRFYRESALVELLSHRIGMKRLLGLADRVINAIHQPASGKQMFPVDRSVEVVQADPADPEVEEIMKPIAVHSLFGRGRAEFKWIINFPWVTGNPDPDLPGRYAFSWKSDNFSNKTYILRGPSGKRAFLWTMVHHRSMKVPYFFSDDTALTIAARQVVLHDMAAGNAAYLTIHHPRLGPVMGIRRNPFVFRKKMDQHFFAHEQIAGELPGEKAFYDGDGDGVFS